MGAQSKIQERAQKTRAIGGHFFPYGIDVCLENRRASIGKTILIGEKKGSELEKNMKPGQRFFFEAL